MQLSCSCQIAKDRDFYDKTGKMVLMNRTILSLMSIAVLIIGLAVFLRLSGEDRLSLSAQEVGSNQSIVKIGQHEFLAETALTTAQHTQGLSERQSLAAGAGMLFVFSPEEEVSFWMHKMQFPLDMIFIANGKVIAIERNTPVPNSSIDPDKLPRYSPNQPVSHVLEINAGEASYIKVGD